MYIYMYMYIYIYIYVHSYMHMYTFIYTYVYICSYLLFIHIYIYICICNYTHIDLYSHICIYIYYIYSISSNIPRMKRPFHQATQMFKWVSTFQLHEARNYSNSLRKMPHQFASLPPFFCGKWKFIVSRPIGENTSTSILRTNDSPTWMWIQETSVTSR